ncbi:hypothetical protein SAMN04487906_1839 [Zhouia amylolytica]|uniref:DUF7793 domain-containing protein n=1 Tax=Zhouia amylolytica TaxID=376730 RepID=A0A1I6T4I3_9FLAO|nr:hypothetical protein [Zhouia amylolytica]SFS83958.1 hypothetical protein SAMN04487906_1839 [Zhouia amylolytica]
MKNCIENDVASFWIQDEILFFNYKPGVAIHLPEAIRIVSDRLKLQQGEAYPILCNIQGVKEVSKQARRYLATEGTLLTKAVAFISHTPLAHILSQLYVKGNMPSIPTCVVQTKEEGIKFLKEFK